ncbi:MAG: AzlD domain-containing protein [Smithellaceae bacterium]|nr:AzlD domain-containing protein [Smithellaceae bacterium]
MDYFITVLGMGIVTYIPRFLPLFFFTNRQLPAWVEEGLDFLPAAILGALVFPLLFLPAGGQEITLLQPHLLSAIPTILFALKTRSLAGTVLVGMGSFWLLEQIL